MPVAAGASCRGSGLGRPPWTRETLYWGGIGGLADIAEDGFDIIMSNPDYLYFGQSFSFSSSLFLFRILFLQFLFSLFSRLSTRGQPGRTRCVAV